jgi:hypothetical protein
LIEEDFRRDPETAVDQVVVEDLRVSAIVSRGDASAGASRWKSLTHGDISGVVLVNGAADYQIARDKEKEMLIECIGRGAHESYHHDCHETE